MRRQRGRFLCPSPDIARHQVAQSSGRPCPAVDLETLLRRSRLSVGAITTLGAMMDVVTQSPSVLMGYRIEIADDLAVAVTLEVADTRTQMQGGEARNIRTLMLTGYGAASFGQALVDAALAVDAAQKE